MSKTSPAAERSRSRNTSDSDENSSRERAQPHQRPTVAKHRDGLSSKPSLGRLRMMAPRGRNERPAPGEPQPGPVSIKTRPLLTPALMARVRAYGSAETVAAGDLIYQLGDN